MHILAPYAHGIKALYVTNIMPLVVDLTGVVGAFLTYLRDHFGKFGVLQQEAIKGGK
jgi:hypothetical protein